jgi:uncharacterized membrane protein (UPF0182 family)
MYIALLVSLLATSCWMAARRRNRRLKLGSTIAGLTLLFFAFLSFWGEFLWFAELGYASRFWTVVTARAIVGVTAAVAGAIIMFVLTRPTGLSGRHQAGTFAIGAAIGGAWGVGAWQLVLRYVNRVSMDVTEPIFGQDAGFYLFVLPLYISVHHLLTWLGGASVLVSAAVVVRGSLLRLRIAGAERGWPSLWRLTAEESQAWRERMAVAHTPLYVPAGFLLLVLGWGFYLDRFELMYSQFGVVTGPGWTDIYVRLPVYWLVAGTSLVLGTLVLLPATRARLDRLFRWPWERLGLDMWLAPSTPFAAVVVAAIAGLGVMPALSQWLKVQPTELALERPYLVNEIAFTRLGFGLHEIENQQFPAAEMITHETVARNRDLLAEVRLWDHRVLQDVYEQFQAIRLYYQFHHVDVDRYRIDDEYRLVMVSAREMLQSNLPAENRTFVNTRFKFTHGNGITLAPVSEFTNEGLPNLLVRGIPPTAETPELRVARPEIYFGMLTTSPVFVNSREPEFDYPSGSENVYSHYAGRGGVVLRNFWRRLVFGWKTDGTRLLMSAYPTAETRALFRRQVLDRVQAVAPFLTLSRDPYIVVSDGRLYWLLEGYTTSSHFPYSRTYDGQERIEYSSGDAAPPLQNWPVPEFTGINYIRNSVKVVVDAYNGSVDLYVFEPDDPLIRVWMRIFADLFKPAAEMPPDLRAHVRYPHELLLMQGLVNARYHMEDPVVFYNQEDLWTRATERYYEQVQPVEPYYIMWTPPGAAAPEFVAMLPFTPKGRQVLIGWMAGLSDGDNYGRLITYQFPKDKRVIGPQQVDTKIDQDPVLKAQLTLWDQLGSRVIRGNVLAIPVNDTLLYVEPIFIEAETAAYPELRIVAVMHGDTLSFAGTFDQALAGVVGQKPVHKEGERTDSSAGVDQRTARLAREANEAFVEYLRLQGDGRFVEAAGQLERLQRVLRDLEPGFRQLPR